MKKSVLLLVAAASLAFASSAGAQLVTVTDPTPDGTFSGQYHCGYEYTWNATTEQWEEDTSKPVYCDQTGYVSAGEDGVVACNGNPDHTRPDNGDPLVGYVWIGPEYADTSDPTFTAPGGLAGAGSNHEDADGEPTGDGPCPDGHTSPEPAPTEPPA